MTQPVKTDAPTGRPKIKLATYLPYRLSVVANAVSRVIARAYNDQHGLSVWEWRVIAVLGETTPLTAGQICATTAMDKVTVSRAIASLNRRDLLQKTPKPDDRRAVLLALSDAGQTLYDQIAPLALAYEQDVLEALSETERKTLFSLLAKIEGKLADGETLGSRDR